MTCKKPKKSRKSPVSIEECTIPESVEVGGYFVPVVHKVCATISVGESTVEVPCPLFQSVLEDIYRRTVLDSVADSLAYKDALRAYKSALANEKKRVGNNPPKTPATIPLAVSINGLPVPVIRHPGGAVTVGETTRYMDHDMREEITAYPTNMARWKAEVWKLFAKALKAERHRLKAKAAKATKSKKGKRP